MTITYNTGPISPTWHLNLDKNGVAHIHELNKHDRYQGSIFFTTKLPIGPLFT